jgi:hypothetical protein
MDAISLLAAAATTTASRAEILRDPSSSHSSDPSSYSHPSHSSFAHTYVTPNASMLTDRPKLTPHLDNTFGAHEGLLNQSELLM